MSLISYRFSTVALAFSATAALFAFILSSAIYPGSQDAQAKELRTPAGPNAATVYLTIDDGPLNGVDNILEVLEAEDVRVTMFMVGEHIIADAAHHDMFLRAKNDPHVLLANHSFSHAHSHYRHFYSLPGGVLQDMEKNNRIMELQGPPFHARLPGRSVFRLPGLSVDDPYISREEDGRERVDFDLLSERGFRLYGWDLEWAHYADGRPVQSIEKLMQEIDSAFQNGKTYYPGHLILLMHDEMFSDHCDGRQSFGDLVRALKDAGYILQTVDHYPPTLVQ